MNLCLLYWKSQGISCGLESGHPVNLLLCEMTGHFLLTNLLTDKLMSSSPSRVINTIGVGYDQTVIDFNDFNMEQSELRRGEPYKRSKLAMALFTVELAKRLEGSLAFCIVHGYTISRSSKNSNNVRSALRFVFYATQCAI